MARFLRLSDEDVERMFRGLAPERDEDLHDLATFLADASERLSRPPRSEVEARHLAMLAEAIESQPASGSTGRRGPVRPRTIRWAAKVAVTAAGIVVLTAALAFAGVDLPGTAAETAFSSVGLDLPNQNQAAADAVDPAKLPADASDTAVRVLTVIHDWFSGAEWNGCEFGARLSQAARGIEGEPDTSHCDAAGAQGSHGQGADASANSEKGRETAEEASGGAASHGAAAGGAVPDEASSAGADGAAAGS